MGRVLIICLFGLALLCQAGDKVRPGLETLANEYRPASAEEVMVILAMQEPLLNGKDVSAALQDWFDGRLLATQRKLVEARAKWQEAKTKLEAPLDDLPPVPKRQWPDGEFTFLEDLRVTEYPAVRCRVVSWKVGDLTQYGLLLLPREAKERSCRLFLYCHGAAFGIPNSFCSWLCQHLVKRNYAVIAPAMRGEDLFQRQIPIQGKQLVSEGEIENLDGEVDDCLSMLSAAWKVPEIVPGEFAMVGHSFGAGVGLLTAAVAGSKCKAVVSYDAWLVNPQRYYWDRMRRGANNWLSWEDYCCLPPLEQLQGLQKRSVIAQAEGLECPLLLFIGGAYKGSVFHLSHEDFCRRLRQLGKEYQYQVIPEGDHNFVLWDGEPARLALVKQEKFINLHYPPLPARESAESTKP